MSKSRKRYVPAPKVTKEMAHRVQAALEAASGQTSTSEAAKRVGLSRVRFQTLLNRGLTGFVKALEPQPVGRPPKSPEVAELEERLRRLEKENIQLKARQETVDRLLGVAADVAAGRLKVGARQTGAQAPQEPAPDAPEEPDGAREALLEEAERMKVRGSNLSLAARAVAISTATLRRWRARHAAGLPLVERRGPRPASRAPAPLAAEQVVRAFNGRIGAAALSHAVPGLSRRDAAAEAARVRTLLEQERRASLARVEVVPGVIRSFDAIDFGTGYGLGSADAGLPFLTGLMLAARYDGHAVAEALSTDFDEYGAPLVLRRDRALQHAVPNVKAVLSRHRVLELAGPPRYPCFYGQLERLNRQGREWVDGRPHQGSVSASELARARWCFNELLPRRKLGWRTAGEVWRARQPVLVDRLELAEEVEELTSKLKEKREARAWCTGTAERLAIEVALKRRRLLSVVQGGWC